MNGRPTDTETFSGQGHEICRSNEASASGTLYSAKYSSKGTVTWYAKPIFNVALNGCDYKASKIVMALKPGIGHEAAGDTTVPGAGFKLNKKLSVSGCSTTSPFYAESLFFYKESGAEHWAEIEY